MRFAFTGGVRDHDPKLPLDTAIVRVHWLSRQYMARRELRSPLVLRYIDDFLAGKCHPLASVATLDSTAAHSTSIPVVAV